MLKDTKITEDTNCTEKNSAGQLVCIMVSLTMVCIENPHFLITGDYDTMLAALYIIHNCSQELARLRNPQMLLHLSNSPHLTRAFEQTFAVNSKYLVVQISRRRMFPAARYIICHFKYAITCVYSLTSATGIQKVCTTCYWQVNIYIYKHGIICKFWKLPNLFSSPIWPELPSKYPVKSKHLVVQIWRRRMFPADRGRIWDLFLTNSSVALCICKAISSVPTSVNFNN